MSNIKVGRQYAAIPLRVGERGLEILLITSRETRRWVVPKGWPEKNLTPREVAERECYEEAGIVGATRKRPVGEFHYVKRLGNGEDLPCVVDVFLLDVAKQVDSWPEKDQRERRWVSPGEAAMMVNEGGLISIFLDLAGLSPEPMPKPLASA